MKQRKIRKILQEKSGRGEVTSFRTETERWTNNSFRGFGSTRMWVTLGMRRRTLTKDEEWKSKK